MIGYRLSRTPCARLSLPSKKQRMTEPQIIRPFSDVIFADIQTHLREVRRLFAWDGIPYHDRDAPEESKFNRWQWHNMPLMKFYHHYFPLVALASKYAGEQLRPTYCFTSFYGPDGVCPAHSDRPPCKFTVDLMVDSDAEEKPWELHIDNQPYVTTPGEAVVYSGTGQPHYRKPMRESSDATFATLVFFHFQGVGYMGETE